MTVFKVQTPTNMAGVGLRALHIPQFIKNHQKIAKKIGWLEVHSENYYAKGGPALNSLKKIRENFPLSLHSVGNSLGCADEIDLSHLKKLKNLVDIIEPFLISDHISWGMIDKKHMNDLLPLPYNQESLRAICRNISKMQDHLKRQILVENPSSYIAFNNCEMDEPDFINEVTKITGCGLLLDVNNIYVSAQNNKNFLAANYIEKLNKNIVQEIHLAGHWQTKIFDGKLYKKILIDTHNAPVKKEVWKIYEMAIKKFGKIASLIEWDQDLPDLAVLLNEAEKANAIMNKK